MEKRTEIPVFGMTCNHCVRAVTKALKKLDGVGELEVSLEKQLATVSFDDTKVSEGTLKDAIVKEGYFLDADKAALAAAAEASPAPIEAEKPALKTITSNFKITGMSCVNCARTIEKGLSKVEEIKEAVVNFPMESLKVEHLEALTSQAIALKVKDLGYGAIQADGNGAGKLSFTIEGMSCVNCSKTIEKVLGKAEGIKSVSVNFSIEQGTVEYDNSIITAEGIYELVKQAGYKAVPREDDGDKEKIAHKEKRSFLLTVFLTIPIALLVHLPQFGVNFHPFGTYQDYAVFGLATIIQIIGGFPFYRGAYYSLKNKSTNMDVLVSLGITAAYFYSTFMLFFGSSMEGMAASSGAGIDTSALNANDSMDMSSLNMEGVPQAAGHMMHHLMFEVAPELLSFILLGKLMEARAKGKAGQALKKLLELQADKARLIVDGVEKEVPASQISVGDIVLVKPGEKIPVDGEIIEGSASIDEAMISGESIPVEKKPGDSVTGATINKSGLLKIRTMRIGKDTVLSQIIKMVQEAQADKAPIQRFADTVSNYFVPAVVSIALISFAVWFFMIGETFLFAFTIMISVLVIACPCALGLATPTAIMVGSGIGLNRGILFKKASVLENISRLNIVLFDKTGTITKGEPKVVGTSFAPGITDNEALMIAASAEASSTHPLAEAVVDYAKEKGITLSATDNFHEESGMGITCTISGSRVIVGKRALLEKNGTDMSGIKSAAERLESEGNTLVFAAKDGKAIGVFGIADVIKDNAPQAIKRLHALGIKTCMISGDNKKIASIVAGKVGIDTFEAEVLPQDKINAVRKYQDQGLKVGMVGDGINDAPALAQANIGIAIGSGTDVAKETGDVVLVKNDLLDVDRAIQLGRKTLTKIKQNFFWALFYNAIGIPIAAGVFYPFTLPPQWCALAMAFSSVSVVSNSLLLLRFSKKL
ncbi:MAG: heavy metal translocating P-type ATPase [Candidatus Schekmanbacteria bacterium]|nr:heavy metal translocating P-type ATPase [Candidatus Schekmanbacteria bacterium]